MHQFSPRIRSARLAALVAVPALALGVAASPVAAHAGHGAHGHHAVDGATAVGANTAARRTTAEPHHHAGGSKASVGGSATSHAGMTMPRSGAARASMFEVGTASRPLIMRSARGPLWKDGSVNAPGTTSHGTLGSAVVAGLIADRREATELATRASLTTAQAAKKLSKRCQTLLKRKASRLSKADRKRRTVCLAQRKIIVARAEEQAAHETAATPGVSAPAAPVKGPDPTTAPPATTPAPSATAVVNAPAATPTPTPVPGSPAPTPTLTPAPAGPVYGAVGVTATEGAEPFKLTRSFTTADIVNFELVNTDAQQHDLYIAPADEHGEISGPPVKIIGRINGRVNGTPTRSSVDMTLAPGRYKLICTVPGHGLMAVNFTVYKPA